MKKLKLALCADCRDKFGQIVNAPDFDPCAPELLDEVCAFCRPRVRASVLRVRLLLQKMTPTEWRRFLWEELLDIYSEWKTTGRIRASRLLTPTEDTMREIDEMMEGDL